MKEYNIKRSNAQAEMQDKARAEITTLEDKIKDKEVEPFELKNELIDWKAELNWTYSPDWNDRCP